MQWQRPASEKDIFMETLEVVVTVSVHLIINDEEKERRKEELEWA